MLALKKYKMINFSQRKEKFAMKRLAVFIGGLLVLPAFAEVAPIFYDENDALEYADAQYDNDGFLFVQDIEDIQEVVDENTTKVQTPVKISRQPVNSTPVTNRTTASRIVPVSSTATASGRGTATGNSSRAVAARTTTDTSPRANASRTVSSRGTTSASPRVTASTTSTPTRTTTAAANASRAAAARTTGGASRTTTGTSRSTTTGGRTTSARTTTASAANASRAAMARPSIASDKVGAGAKVTVNSSGVETLVQSGNNKLYNSRIGVRSGGTAQRSPTMRMSSLNTSTTDAVSVAAATADMDDLAELTDYCKAQYMACMDDYCNVLDDSQGRCSCSANLKKYSKSEAALKSATEELQDVAQKIQYIGLTKREVESLFTQTEAEAKMQSTTDNSQLKTNLDKVKDMIINVQSGGATSSADTGLNFDLSGLLEFSFDSTGFDIGSLFGTTSGASVSNQRGEELYKTASARCKATVLKSCTAQGVDASVITNAYDLEIDRECIAYERSLNDSNDQMLATVRNAKNVLQKARLMVAQQKNAYDMRGCINALDECMQDEFVCGSEYENCLDPTGRYIVNGEIVVGSQPGHAIDPELAANVASVMTSDVCRINLYRTWDMPDVTGGCQAHTEDGEFTTYINPTNDQNNAWGSGPNDSLATYITRTVGSNTAEKTSENMSYYLQNKIGYVAKDRNYGMCISILNKCQDYTYEGQGTSAKYKEDNEVIKQYLARTLVQIKSKQDEILSNYAETCITDVTSCLSQNGYPTEEPYEWGTTGTTKANIAINACRAQVVTCMSVNGYSISTPTPTEMNCWVQGLLYNYITDECNGDNNKGNDYTITISNCSNGASFTQTVVGGSFTFSNNTCSGAQSYTCGNNKYYAGDTVVISGSLQCTANYPGTFNGILTCGEGCVAANSSAYSNQSAGTQINVPNCGGTAKVATWECNVNGIAQTLNNESIFLVPNANLSCVANCSSTPSTYTYTLTCDSNTCNSADSSSGSAAPGTSVEILDCTGEQSGITQNWKCDLPINSNFENTLNSGNSFSMPNSVVNCSATCQTQSTTFIWHKVTLDSNSNYLYFQTGGQCDKVYSIMGSGNTCPNTITSEVQIPQDTSGGSRFFTGYNVSSSCNGVFIIDSNGIIDKDALRELSGNPTLYACWGTFSNAQKREIPLNNDGGTRSGTNSNLTKLYLNSDCGAKFYASEADADACEGEITNIGAYTNSRGRSTGWYVTIDGEKLEIADEKGNLRSGAVRFALEGGDESLTALPDVLEGSTYIQFDSNLGTWATQDSAPALNEKDICADFTLNLFPRNTRSGVQQIIDGYPYTYTYKYGVGFLNNNDDPVPALPTITNSNDNGYELRGYYPKKFSWVTNNTDAGRAWPEAWPSQNTVFPTPNLVLVVPQGTSCAEPLNLYAGWAKKCPDLGNTGTCTLVLGVDGTVEYNVTCNEGYTISGEGANATCVSSGNPNPNPEPGISNKLILSISGTGGTRTGTGSDIDELFVNSNCTGQYFTSATDAQSCTGPVTNIGRFAKENARSTGWFVDINGESVMIATELGALNSDAVASLLSAGAPTNPTATPTVISGAKYYTFNTDTGDSVWTWTVPSVTSKAICAEFDINFYPRNVGSIDDIRNGEPLTYHYVYGEGYSEQATMFYVPTLSGYTLRGYYPKEFGWVDNNTTSGSAFHQWWLPILFQFPDANWVLTVPAGTTCPSELNLYAGWAKNCTNPFQNGSCTLDQAGIYADGGRVHYTIDCEDGYEQNGEGANATCVSSGNPNPNPEPGTGNSVTLSIDGLGGTRTGTGSDIDELFVNSNCPDQYFTSATDAQSCNNPVTNIGTYTGGGAAFTGWRVIIGDDEVALTNAQGQLQSAAVPRVLETQEPVPASPIPTMYYWFSATTSGPTGEYSYTFDEPYGTHQGCEGPININFYPRNTLSDGVIQNGDPVTCQYQRGVGYSGACADSNHNLKFTAPTLSGYKLRGYYSKAFDWVDTDTKVGRAWPTGWPGSGTLGNVYYSRRINWVLTVAANATCPETLNLYAGWAKECPDLGETGTCAFAFDYEHSYILTDGDVHYEITCAEGYRQDGEGANATCVPSDGNDPEWIGGQY